MLQTPVRRTPPPQYQAREPALEGHDHAWRKLRGASGLETTYRCDICSALYPAP